jgi:hypothetical protein
MHIFGIDSLSLPADDARYPAHWLTSAVLPY